MIINNLKVNQYRNLDEVEISFHPYFNVFHGLNGQGKTNFIEAITYLSTLKSFRGSPDFEIIKKDKEFFFTKIQCQNEITKYDLQVSYTLEKKKIMIDNNEIKKLNEIYGILNTNVFTPNDVNIFEDEPKKRRNFLDSEISKISPSYLFSLQKYNKLLKERNSCLKENMDLSYLEVLTNNLAEIADYLINKRIEFIEILENNLQPIFNKLYGDDKIKISIKYKTYRENNKTSLDYFNESLEEDRLRMVTTLGPHKDDWKLYFDGYSVENYASQGQKRLSILSIKLALLNVIEQLKGDKAIVILDDVLSELDLKKRKFLINYLYQRNQVFITLANEKELTEVINKEGKYFLIENGLVVKEEEK